jgi:hypothetical protein
MALNIQELKKNSKKAFSNLKEAAQKLNSNNFNDEDDRFWTPTVDNNGNGSAIIRFLPAPPGEEFPYVRLWDHGFKGPSGLWYIEKSLTTLGKDDPVTKLNNKLWAAGDKQAVREQKRRLYFISNILVVRDPAHPENEGKVFLYRYGKKIFDKINDIMFPELEDDPEINPFDPWTGANFRLRIRKVEGFRNYDKSDFDSPTAIGDDDEIVEIMEKEHSLQEFLDPKNFKSYQELEEKLFKVLDMEAKATKATPAISKSKTEEANEDDESLPWNDDTVQQEDDDELAAFKSMLEKD